jgi:hypothetical protein
MTLQNFKDFITSFREMILVCIFLLLLIAPGCFNSILVHAGFTEGRVMGFTWKEKAIKSKQVADSTQLLAEEAAMQIEKMQNKLDSVSKKLADVGAATGNPDLRALHTDIEKSNVDFVKSNVTFKDRIQLQKSKISELFRAIKQ